MEVKPSGPLEVRLLFPAAETDYLWIDPAIAGTWFPVADDSAVAIRFPPAEGDTDLDVRDAYPSLHMEDGRTVAFGAALLEVRVDVPASISQWEKASNVRIAVGQARRAVAGFLAWCKVRQPWIGPYDTVPEPLPDVLIAEKEIGEAYTEAIGRRRERLSGAEVRRMDEPPLLPRDVAEFIRRGTSGDLPDPASAFLADSHFAAFCIRPRDLKRAVLLAAFACEIRIREALREHVAPDRIEQFEEWFPAQGQPRKRVSNWTGPVAKTLVSRSLEEEDGDLYKRVRRIALIRNELAHEGKSPELEDVLESVRAARRLFEWIDTW